MTVNGKSVPIVIGGQTYRLRFDFNALLDMQDELGIDDPTKLAVTSLKGVRAMLWAALIHDHPTLTARNAGDLIQSVIDDGGALETIGEKLVEALRLGGWLRKEGTTVADTAPFGATAAGGSPMSST